jgi:general secretion pathway protein H
MMIHRAKGYTLIEILIVIFIISIVSTVALLTIGHNQNRRLETLATQITQLLTLAEEQAMLQPAVVGLSIGESSFQFFSYQPDADGKQMHWVEMQDKAMRAHVIPDGIRLQLQLADQAAAKDETEQPSPQIIISTNGDITPFTLSIGKQGDAPRYVVKGEADGTVTYHELP